MLPDRISTTGLALGAVLILASCGEDASFRMGEPAQDASSPPADSSAGMNGPPMGSAPSQQPADPPPATVPDPPTSSGMDATPSPPTSGTGSPQPGGGTAPPEPTNTQNRHVDPAAAKDTPESDGDRRISDSIRQVLSGRQDLSSSAKNVMISTRDGIVTLRGQVADAHERDIIATLASNQGGVVRVENQIEGPNP